MSIQNIQEFQQELHSLILNDTQTSVIPIEKHPLHYFAKKWNP